MVTTTISSSSSLMQPSLLSVLLAQRQSVDDGKVSKARWSSSAQKGMKCFVDIFYDFDTNAAQTHERHTKCSHTRVKYTGIGSSTLAYLSLLTKFNRKVMCDGVKWRKPNNTHTISQPFWHYGRIIFFFCHLRAFELMTKRRWGCTIANLTLFYHIIECCCLSFMRTCFRLAPLNRQSALLKRN